MSLYIFSHFLLKTNMTGLLIQSAKAHAGYRDEVSLGQRHFCTGSPPVYSSGVQGEKSVGITV